MDEEVDGRATKGRHTGVADFVPASHRRLPLLRLYLPFYDPKLAAGSDTVRWSRYVDVEQESASLSWFEVADRVAEHDPAVRDLVPCRGELDDDTAAALRDAVGDRAMRCLRWIGYGESPRPASPRRVFGDDFSEAPLRPEDLRAGRRIPEFAWDAEGRLAWGAQLFPDSLIVAAEVPLFRELRNDPRLDTDSARIDRDVLPISAGE